LSCQVHQNSLNTDSFIDLLMLHVNMAPAKVNKHVQ